MAAWQYFARQQVDIAVVEVGLGGRLDATNVCGTPLATVIVSIGRDHWQRLGNTLADIAGEKAGILKPGVRAIAGPLPEAAAAVVTQKATELNAPLTWVLPAVEEVVMGNPNTTPTLIYEGLRYPQALLGDHQRVNSACAIATLQVLQDQGWKISDEAIVQGLSQVRWPGRLQKGQWQGHELLIDGAHNTDAARSLRAFIDRTYPDEPITWLMGLLETKDHQGVLRTVLRQGDHLHLIPVPGHVSADPEALAAIAQTIDPSPAVVQTHADLEDGLTAAVDALPGKTPIVFCGSLYLIGTFYERYGLLG
ncbi:MAG: bifunctional folylpolyglutamate synthase/dihydrofolate synthase [Cyanobacteria bacterium J06635_11]